MCCNVSSLNGHRLVHLDVEGDRVRPGVQKPADVARGLGDHQVDVEWQLGEPPERRHDVRPERDVRYEVAVHDVEMEAIDARPLQFSNDAIEIAEVGGEDAGRDRDSHSVRTARAPGAAALSYDEHLPATSHRRRGRRAGTVGGQLAACSADLHSPVAAHGRADASAAQLASKRLRPLDTAAAATAYARPGSSG